jgi:hypothetical protein
VFCACEGGFTRPDGRHSEEAWGSSEEASGEEEGGATAAHWCQSEERPGRKTGRGREESCGEESFCSQLLGSIMRSACAYRYFKW